jgi:hypothetical protein
MEKVKSEEIEFFRSIPFFGHLTHNQVKTLWNHKYVQTVMPIRGKEMIIENRVNPFVYIVRKGDFIVKKVVTKRDSGAHKNGVKKFLCGQMVPASLRSVFNNKIGLLTGKSQFTQERKQVVQEEVLTF